MSLLELARATKRFTSGQRELVVLDDVSLTVAAGECVAVYGTRRSGRTTLLRIVAGLLTLDAGEVRFDGRASASRGRRALGVEIGYGDPGFDVAHGGVVAEHVALALLARGVGRKEGCARALAALERAGASACAERDPRELRPGELVRAGIARALVTEPRLLLLDEPTSGVEPEEREPVLALLRELADGGLAVLATVGEPVAGPHRVLALDGGRLGGDAVPAEAPIVSLTPRRVEPVA